MRQFLDAGGVEWSVYDVIPRQEDRRFNDRRDPAPVSEQPAEERRLDDRRVGVAARPVRLTRGWLCFESADERRRLQPIPDRWFYLADAELQVLLQDARVAPRRKRPDREAGASS